jgi:molecular chaperone DnaK
MSNIIVGIDLGTTNSAVAVVQDGQPRILSKGDQKLIPSVVGYAKQAGWMVGRPALNQYTLDPKNTIRSIKRKMGRQEKIRLGGREFSPQQISAFILRELKTIAEENLGQPVDKAVITVPAYFTNAQRQATKEAGEIAGLEVVRIINEPTAAALAYGLNREDDHLALIYDLGGGTFDVSLVEMIAGIVEVQASHGDTHLGGDDFDHALAEHASKLFYKKHRFSLKDNRLANARLIAAAETAKIRLSNFSEADLREEYLTERDGVPLHLETKIERSKFEDLVKDFLKRTLESTDKVMQDAQLAVGQLNRVLLVGGSTRMPIVWDLVANYTGLEPDAEINPDEVVALGAAIQAAIIAGQPVNSILVDVTPYSLGIETAAEVSGQVIPDIYNVLIRRNSTIPATKEQIFSTLYPNQSKVHIKVYQGEAPIASANILLGEFMISGLRSIKPRDYPSVNVRFDFDVNGMLHVRATGRVTGTQEGISIQATQARLTPQEIAQARQELSELDLSSAETDEAPGSEAKPVVDEETQALLRRAQDLLNGDTLTELQRITLPNLMQDIIEAKTQDELDDLAEELLGMLFDLE